MPVVNPLARELVFKVVYYGPGLGGKTTTLQHIHTTAKPEHRGKMVSLATPVDRTLYFDFLPIRVPHVRGLGVRLQLFTVPGQMHYNATRKLVLTGADGVVLVFDSQQARSDANVETLENLKDNLGAHGKSLGQVPHVIQYNKRDLYDVVPIEELERSFNRYGAPSFATVATNGEGVYEALEAITRAVLEDFERRVPESRALERTSLELPEGGLVEALRRAESVTQDAPFLRSAVSSEDSALSRLSDVPEADPGEAAARAVAFEPAAAPRFDTVLDFAGEHPSEFERAVPASVAPHVTLRAAGTPSSSLSAVADEGMLAVVRDLRAAGSSVFSFAAFFPLLEGETVRAVEAALAAGQPERALSGVEQLIARALASAAPLARSPANPTQDPALVLLLLGVDATRYLGFRALLQKAESGQTISLEAALGAYAFVLELRHALRRLS